LLARRRQCDSLNMGISDISALPDRTELAAGSRRLACSVGALLLAISLWSILASGVGQPLRALGVLAFFGAPGLLAGRFVRGPGPLETILFSLGGAAATWGVAAGLAFAADWTPESVVICLSALVGLVAAIDLSWSVQRRRRGAVA
jgi:hypothetical protein